MKTVLKNPIILGALLVGAIAAPVATQGGLSFNGINQYVTFGRATNLGSATFTLETWFNWTGRGTTAGTGVGGVTAIPLITKLRAEFDGNDRDGNYFLGIRPADGVLVADLEEGVSGASPGTNHPVSGVTAITTSVWHHAAVTYDGTNWQLFLDGTLETTLFVGQPPRWDSIQQAALASSLNSTGAPQGCFAGALDEVRIWNYARPASQIASNKNRQIPSAPGLVGRWSLEETKGSIAHDSSGSGVDGRLVKGPVWISGHRAIEDVVTPIKLITIDPERTAALRQAEARRLPPIFRYDPDLVEQAEKSLRASFLITREKFMAELDEAFPRRRATSQVVTNAKFARLVASFRSKNRGFPLDTNLAQIWALGQPDNLIQAELALKLRDVMTQNIHPDALPSEAKFGPSNVRLLSLSFSNTTANLDLVDKQSVTCSRTNLHPISRVRSDLVKSYPTNQQAVARYLNGFVKENCLFDADLTQQSRARRTESILAAEHYEPGQVIVKKGQVIDGRLKAALEELKARTTADELKAQAVAEQVRAQAAAEQIKAENALRELRQQTALAEFKSQHFGQQNRWLLIGLVVVAVASSLAVWRLARLKRLRTLLPVPVPRGTDGLLYGQPAADIPGEPAGAPPEGLGAEEWKARAFLAEQRAAQSTAALRAGLLPHLAQWLKNKLVGRLLADRSHLLSIQERAERAVAELEQRLAKLQAPLEERLQAYEQRIAELEQELTAQGEENRELIQAQIDLTRKKLAAEQGQDQVTWN